VSAQRTTEEARQAFAAWARELPDEMHEIPLHELISFYHATKMADNRPQFDAMQPEQEALAIDISLQIAKGARPDPVQILEWAQALYEAEMGAAA
jgi:hypothetical protein